MSIKKILLVLFIFPVFGLGQELSQLRTDYPKANEDEVVTERLFDVLSAVSKKDDAVLVAFRGAVLTLKAKYASGFKAKKGFFKEGAEFLEHAIKIAPDNAEIRCIRLGVQENSPKIVGYKDSISEDKKFLLDNYTSVTDSEIKKFIKGYVLLSDAFSEVEKELF